MFTIESNLGPPGFIGKGSKGDSEGLGKAGQDSEFESIVKSTERTQQKFGQKKIDNLEEDESKSPPHSYDSRSQVDASDENRHETTGRVRHEKLKGSFGKKNAIRKFMDSLEGELGISAERFLAALAHVPKELKDQPLTASAPFLMEQMGIIMPQEKQQAVSQYLELAQKFGLAQSEDRETVPLKLNPELFVHQSESAGTENMPIQSMTRDRSKINAAIDELNKKFFNVTQDLQNKNQEVNLSQASNPISESVPPKTLDLQLDGSLADIPISEKFPQSKFPSFEGNLSIPRLSNSVPLAPQNNQNDPQRNLDNVIPEMVTLSQLEWFTQEPQIGISPRVWTPEELPYLAQGTPMLQSVGIGSVNENEISSVFETESDGDLSNDSSLLSDTMREENESSSVSDLPLSSFEGISSLQREPQGVNSASINSAEGKSSIPSENVSRVSKATEMLASKGGGEVKVILEPAGLGAIQLRVKLHEGKIQVEMKADNQSAQKLLETSLGDLKQALSNHKIAIDSVKVDVGGDFANQDQRSGSFAQQNSDHGRDQARQFMQQFRQENFLNRQPIFDAPGFKSYQVQKEEPLAPISDSVRPRSLVSQGKGKEINVVA